MSKGKMSFTKIDTDRAVVGGRYIVTTRGEIFGLRKNGREVKLKPRKHSNGYLRFCYCDQSGQTDIYIHRIVAQVFLEKPVAYNEVNHKDGNKENNDVSNLEWCNRHMNNLHAFKTGLRKYSELKEMAQRPRRKARRLSEADVRRIRGEDFGVSNVELGKRYGICKDSIRKIKTGKTYKEVV